MSSSHDELFLPQNELIGGSAVAVVLCGGIGSVLEQSGHFNTTQSLVVYVVVSNSIYFPVRFPSGGRIYVL